MNEEELLNRIEAIEELLIDGFFPAILDAEKRSQEAARLKDFVEKHGKSFGEDPEIAKYLIKQLDSLSEEERSADFDEIKYVMENLAALREAAEKTVNGIVLEESEPSEPTGLDPSANTPAGPAEMAEDGSDKGSEGLEPSSTGENPEEETFNIDDIKWQDEE